MVLPREGDEGIALLDAVRQVRRAALGTPLGNSLGSSNAEHGGARAQRRLEDALAHLEACAESANAALELERLAAVRAGQMRHGEPRGDRLTGARFTARPRENRPGHHAARGAAPGFDDGWWAADPCAGLPQPRAAALREHGLHPSSTRERESVMRQASVIETQLRELDSDLRNHAVALRQ
jgi:hypothetical protein